MEIRIFKEEFKNGMKDYGIELTLTELDSCMTVFEKIATDQ